MVVMGLPVSWAIEVLAPWFAFALGRLPQMTRRGNRREAAFSAEKEFCGGGCALLQGKRGR